MAENLKWVPHLDLFSMARVIIFSVAYRAYGKILVYFSALSIRCLLFVSLQIVFFPQAAKFKKVKKKVRKIRSKRVLKADDLLPQNGAAYSNEDFGSR